MTFRCFLITIVFILAFTFVRPTFAHGGEPRLEISVERINPGGAMEVRGVEFDYEQSVTLYLERPGIVIQLGEVVADLEGIFLHIVVLPIDLPAGVYNVRAATDHHEVLSPALTVQGAPLLDEGRGQGGRDERAGLPAPMPTYAPVVVPGGVSQNETQATSQEQPMAKATVFDPNTWNTTILISSIIFGIGIIALMAVGIFRKK
jgi:hypothetical protein